MKFSFTRRLVLLAIVPIVASAFFADWYVLSRISERITTQTQQELLRRARLAVWALDNLAVSPTENSDVLNELGHTCECRITLVRQDGSVTYDSTVTDSRLMQNHGDRPEIRAALTSGVGSAIRFSTTTKERMLYVAVPLFAFSDAKILRMAISLSFVDAIIADWRYLLLFGSFLGILLVASVSGVFVMRTTKPLRHLTEMADRMSAGDLKARSQLSGDDEIGRLAGALEHLAEQLSRTLLDLRTERDLIFEILQSMQEGILLIDDTQKIVLANPSWKSMMSLESEPVGRTIIEVCRVPDFRDFVAADSISEASLELPKLPGPHREFLVRKVKMTGTIRGFLFVFVDVTHIKRLEKVRSDFVANASHELRTPVGNLRSAAETLGTFTYPDPTTHQFISMIERNALRLQHLIDDLLDLSRIESAGFIPRREPFNLTPLIQMVVGHFRPHADAKHIAFHVTPPNEPCVIHSDSQCLEQILSNLIDNAIKYGRPSGTVEICTVVRDQEIEIQVKDDGSGISPEHLPRIFERFYRVDPSRSRDLGGTGLGLAIVKHLTESIKGRVTVQSTLNKGTIFSVYLPRVQSQVV